MHYTCVFRVAVQLHDKILTSNNITQFISMCHQIRVSACVHRACYAQGFNLLVTCLYVCLSAIVVLLQVAAVLDHPALVVTRSVEWGQVILGFEQAQKYTVYDQDGNVVALMAEDQTGLADALGRQVLRGRRSFTATVLSPDGNATLQHPIWHQFVSCVTL